MRGDVEPMTQMASMHVLTIMKPPLYGALMLGQGLCSGFLKPSGMVCLFRALL